MTAPILGVEAALTTTLGIAEEAAVTTTAFEVAMVAEMAATVPYVSVRGNSCSSSST